MNRVCVMGSINMDMVLKVDSMPKVGQTIFASDIHKVPGGKGANQAVAAQKSGAQVHIIGKVGNDEDGNALIKELLNYGVNTDYVSKEKNKPTGVAIITVNNQGDNSIIVVSGCNMDILNNDIDSSENIISKTDILVSQFEIPIKTIERGFKIAKKYNKITVLNPSPVLEISDGIIQNTDIIIPNEVEIYALTKIHVNNLKSASEAGKLFIDRGVKAVIITLGEIGAALITEHRQELIPAYKVQAIDTTAAGDSFLGAVVSKIDIEHISFENLKDAVVFGNQVSSITVQRKGAQPSIPDFKEVKRIYR
ncbi:ribokinase [Clostridium tyrobutyricum]|uniref:ribokinase n=1 Tax=Clostridium tyrobutyricum TaxID=1519 RepID=UPI00057FBAD1|nr:ribokinase [Clostridium tyrobutyricum]